MRDSNLHYKVGNKVIEWEVAMQLVFQSKYLKTRLMANKSLQWWLMAPLSAAKSIFLLCVEPDWIFVLFWRPKMANLESCANSHLYNMSTFVAEGRIFPVSWTPLLSYFFTGKNMSESPATTSALPTLASSVAFPYTPILGCACTLRLH